MITEIEKIDYPKRIGNFIMWCGLTQGQEKLLELFSNKIEKEERLIFDEVFQIYKEYVAKDKTNPKLSYAKNWFVMTIGRLVLKRFIVISQTKLIEKI